MASTMFLKFLYDEKFLCTGSDSISESIQELVSFYSTKILLTQDVTNYIYLRNNSNNTCLELILLFTCFH